MGLDLKKVRACYRCLSVDYADCEIQKLCDKVKHLYIYGISRLGKICKKQLERAGIKFEGFVVSNGQMKPEIAEGRKVFYLSDGLEEDDNCGFVLAVQPINENAIVGILKKHGVKNYYNPYVLKDSYR